MDGILSVIKPPGITSHDVIGILRKYLRTKKIGHSGTLDPLAMGVLPIYIGKATRLIPFIDKTNKEYVAECEFGYATDTEDSTGNTIAYSDTQNIPTWEALQEVCRSFVGNIWQKPSMYSAIKINGKKAYELVRQGKRVDIPKREIMIDSIEVIAYQFPYMTIRVTCSSGTYIRALLRDIAEKLGHKAVMTSLVRSREGEFSIENSITLEELEEGAYSLLPASHMVSHYPKMICEKKEAMDLIQGKRISRKHFETINEGIHALYYKDQFLGMAQVDSVCIRGYKILYVPED